MSFCTHLTLEKSRKTSCYVSFFNCRTMEQFLNLTKVYQWAGYSEISPAQENVLTLFYLNFVSSKLLEHFPFA